MPVKPAPNRRRRERSASVSGVLHHTHEHSVAFSSNSFGGVCMLLCRSPCCRRCQAQALAAGSCAGTACSGGRRVSTSQGTCRCGKQKFGYARAGCGQALALCPRAVSCPAHALLLHWLYGEVHWLYGSNINSLQPAFLSCLLSSKLGALGAVVLALLTTMLPPSESLPFAGWVLLELHP